MPGDDPLAEPRRSLSPAITHAEFARHVHGALAHLSDPVYLQTHPLSRFPPASSASRASTPGRALRQACLDGIEALRPESVTRSTATAARGHELLTFRYLEGLEYSEVQSRLGLGRSQYYLEHQRALEALVALLWESWGLEERAEVEQGEIQTSGIPH